MKGAANASLALSVAWIKGWREKWKEKGGGGGRVRVLEGSGMDQGVGEKGKRRGDKR